MKTIRSTIEIARPQEVVFDLTQNYAKRLEWDPYLTEAYLLKEAAEPAVSYCQIWCMAFRPLSLLIARLPVCHL